MLKVLKYPSLSLILILSVVLQAKANVKNDTVYIRINQVGYLSGDEKVAVAFSQSPIKGKFSVHNAATGEQVFQAKAVRSKQNGWGIFDYHYLLSARTKIK